MINVGIGPQDKIHQSMAYLTITLWGCDVFRSRQWKQQDLYNLCAKYHLSFIYILSFFPMTKFGIETIGYTALKT
jgi:hypothetical protein